MENNSMLEILRHATGVDRYGNIIEGNRNWFATEKESDDYTICNSMVDLGLMKFCRTMFFESVFSVTRSGIKFIEDNMEIEMCDGKPLRWYLVSFKDYELKVKAVSRAQAKYRAFMELIDWVDLKRGSFIYFHSILIK